MPSPLLAAVDRHAGETYPEECCGILLGFDRGLTRLIEEVRPVENQHGAERARRYLIAPTTIREVESELGSGRQQVVGFYHSHPDLPARPSAFDEEHAWPWYTYLVVGMKRGGLPDHGVFELDPEARRFLELPLRRSPGGNGSVVQGGTRESS